MNKISSVTLFTQLCTACTSNKVVDSGASTDTTDTVSVETNAPVVTAESTFTVLFEEDVEYA